MTQMEYDAEKKRNLILYIANLFHLSKMQIMQLRVMGFFIVFYFLGIIKKMIRRDFLEV